MVSFIPLTLKTISIIGKKEKEKYDSVKNKKIKKDSHSDIGSGQPICNNNR